MHQWYNTVMNISVVIPAYNEEEYIGKCLKSLFAQSEKAEEIIVVDNNSTDKTVSIAKSFGVKVIREKQQGLTPARNKGFNQANGDIIGRIDADTRVPKDWIKKIKKRFIQEKDLVALSGPTIFEDKKFNKFLAFPEKIFIASFKKAIGSDLLYGPNIALRKSAWEKVKNITCLNDKIVHEDLDLAIHLSQLRIGKVVFDKTHKVGASERRWKHLMPYIEYPYRYLRTLQHHKQSLHGIKTKTAMVRKALPKPRRIARKIRRSASTSFRIVLNRETS